MKTEITENSGCYFMELVPETMVEAAMLVRMSINSTKELRGLTTHAMSDGTFCSQIAIGIRKTTSSEIRKAT